VSGYLLKTGDYTNYRRETDAVDFVLRCNRNIPTIRTRSRPDRLLPINEQSNNANTANQNLAVSNEVASWTLTGQRVTKWIQS